MNKIDCTQVVNLFNGDLLLVFSRDESKRCLDIHKQNIELGNSLRRFTWSTKDQKSKKEILELINVLRGEPSESDVLFVELSDLSYVCSFGDFEVKIQKWELKGFKGDLLDFVVEECGL